MLRYWPIECTIVTWENEMFPSVKLKSLKPNTLKYLISDELHFCGTVRNTENIRDMVEGVF